MDESLQTLDYEAALGEQQRLSEAGRAGWLLFRCPPTITRGRRAEARDVLAETTELARLGVRLLDVDRGGQVTYHGPGQIIGFPYGSLERHTGDARGVRRFVEGLQKGLAAFLTREGCVVDEVGDPSTAGVWLREGGERRKIVSIGLHFSNTGIRHGFALNVSPEVLTGFELINPCGEVGARPTSLFATACDREALEAVGARLAAALSRPIAE